MGETSPQLGVVVVVGSRHVFRERVGTERGPLSTLGLIGRSRVQTIPVDPYPEGN